MDRIDKFAKEMEKIDYYIANPLDFLYEHIENPTLQEIVECYRYIYLNNQEMIQTHREYLKHLQEYIANVRPLHKEEYKQPEKAEREVITVKQDDKDLSEAIDYVTYCNFDKELDIFLDTLTDDDIIRLKLHFLKEIKLHQLIIREAILEDSFADIKELQSELMIYSEILERLKQYTKKSDTLDNNTEAINNSNIILMPNSQSTYLLEDIKRYPERCKEIKNAFDKIIEGYFLQTKDLKAIEGAKENLYEYRNPNGLRILYFVKNNLILISSLFFKDKQKSTRITAYYDEAHSRYYNTYNYILSNVNNPDFYIEQAELVGQIYSFLEANMVVSKGLGD